MGSFDRLWVAAHTGNLRGLRQELDLGAPIEGRDPLGHTALMEAAKYGHTSVVQELLDRGANPDAMTMLGQSARTYASSEAVHQMLDLAARKQQLQQYDVSYAQGSQASSSAAAAAYQPGSDGLPLSLGLEQYGQQGLSPSYMGQFGQAAVSQTWPQALANAQGLSSRQAGQSPAGDHATSLSSMFDQLTLGQPMPQQPMSAFPNSQVLLGREYGEIDPGALQTAYGLSQSAPGSLQAQLNSLGLSSGTWSSQLSSALSNPYNSSLTSLQLHQQRNGHRPVCRYWFSGRCRYGPACRFAHPPSPGVRTAAASSTPVCRYFQSGTCRFGSACRFRHIAGSPASSYSIGTPTAPSTSSPLTERSQLSELLNRAGKRS